MGLEEIRKLKENAGKPKAAKQYSIPKRSAKKMAKEAKEKEERGDDDTELQKWYRARMKQMTGYCSECHAKTETHIFRYATFSICHILAKNKNACPSVATHPQNWIELCVDHHNLFDKASWEERQMMGCWTDVLKRLTQVEPDLDDTERRHLPDFLKK